MSNSTDLTKRLLSNIEDTGLLDAWFYHLIDKQLAKRCESPIEILLGAALIFYDKMEVASAWPLVLAGQEEISDWPAEARLLIPQYRFEEYRIDWVYRDGDNLTFIECDGHDFHERTKVQAARDKQRDRNIQSAGHPILRFTGSEIHKDALGCAAQIAVFADQRNVPPEFRERA